MANQIPVSGGELAGEVLARHGVEFVYTLCGGHISPVLVGAEEQGIRVIDTRHEATAVFAADATARLTGKPGVAVVTAGPGVTNTVTAMKNAQMAQSPVVLIGGAAATLLKGRGALQDIDQRSLFKPIVKWSAEVKAVREIVPALEQAFREAQDGVPGPVFVEIPVDLLYGKDIVRSWTLDSVKGSSLTARATRAYLAAHVERTFARSGRRRARQPETSTIPQPESGRLAKLQRMLESASRPLLIIGSQATLDAGSVDELAAAVRKLGVPVYLSGMARGLLGPDEPLHQRHGRSKALRQADAVVLAGVPADFRLNYGQAIPGRAAYASINRSKDDLRLNRKPDVGVLADPSAALRRLADRWTMPSDRWAGWRQQLVDGDAERDASIAETAELETEFVNPVRLCRQIDERLPADSVIVADGGDFVATASYTVRPRGPLRWLDPGAFGTLGAGGGFALAAGLVNPDAEVWLLYGDGSCGYSIAEFDTFVRHRVPVLAVVGNDASWAQIAREQVDVLGTALSTELAYSDYHVVAQGFGAVGLAVDAPDQVDKVLREAQTALADGRPVLINAKIGSTDFRKGSISM